MKTSRLLAAFFLLLGLASVVVGVRLWLGAPLPNGEGTCKAMCGLTMLVTAVFGDGPGRLTGGTLWVGAGLAFGFVGVAFARKGT
jgi:hypothetical protein